MSASRSPGPDLPAARAGHRRPGPELQLLHHHAACAGEPAKQSAWSRPVDCYLLVQLAYMCSGQRLHPGTTAHSTPKASRHVRDLHVPSYACTITISVCLMMCQPVYLAADKRMRAFPAVQRCQPPGRLQVDLPAQYWRHGLCRCGLAIDLRSRGVSCKPGQVHFVNDWFQILNWKCSLTVTQSTQGQALPGMLIMQDAQQ